MNHARQYSWGGELEEQPGGVGGGLTTTLSPAQVQVFAVCVVTLYGKGHCKCELAENLDMGRSCWGTITKNKISYQPRKALCKGRREEKQLYYPITTKAARDPHCGPSAKGLRKQEEVSPRDTAQQTRHSLPPDRGELVLKQEDSPDGTICDPECILNAPGHGVAACVC